MENKALSTIEDAEVETKILQKRKPGRPPGAKNKDTLFKELMAGKFQSKAQNEVEKVLDILFLKAQEGDMKAIKMVLDRVIPTTKAVDLEELEKGGLQINISVGDMKSPETIEPLEGNYEEIIDS